MPSYPVYADVRSYDDGGVHYRYESDAARRKLLPLVRLFNRPTLAVDNCWSAANTATSTSSSTSSSNSGGGGRLGAVPELDLGGVPPKIVLCSGVVHWMLAAALPPLFAAAPSWRK